MLQGCIFNWTFVCMFFLISGFPAVCGFTGFVLFLFVLVVKKKHFLFVTGFFLSLHAGFTFLCRVSSTVFARFIF